MTKNEARIGVLGKIIEGRHKGWYILVEDDAENTGGFLILVFNNINKERSTEGYDRFAEDIGTLNEMFKEAKWQVCWIEEK